MISFEQVSQNGWLPMTSWQRILDDVDPWDKPPKVEEAPRLVSPGKIPPVESLFDRSPRLYRSSTNLEDVEHIATEPNDTWIVGAAETGTSDVSIQTQGRLIDVRLVIPENNLETWALTLVHAAMLQAFLGHVQTVPWDGVYLDMRAQRADPVKAVAMTVQSEWNLHAIRDFWSRLGLPQYTLIDPIPGEMPGGLTFLAGLFPPIGVIINGIGGYGSGIALNCSRIHVVQVQRPT